jgi:hypothetical protein
MDYETFEARRGLQSSEAPLCARLSKPRAVRRSPRPAEGQNRSLILSGLTGARQTPTSGDQSCTPKHRVDRQATFRTDRSMGFVVRKCFRCSGECQQFCERLDGAPQIDHPISNLKVALGGNWPKVKPFVMASASQFRVPPPPSLKSTAFKGNLQRRGSAAVSLRSSPAFRTRPAERLDARQFLAL